MLLQLEDSQPDQVNKLLDFAKRNHLKLSVVDDCDEHHLPGKSLNINEIAELIESSRSSGTISMQDAHGLIRKNSCAD